MKKQNPVMDWFYDRVYCYMKYFLLADGLEGSRLSGHTPLRSKAFNR